MMLWIIERWKTIVLLLAAAGLATAGVYWYNWFNRLRAAKAGDVVLTNGKVVGSFKHVRGWAVFDSPKYVFTFLTGVPSYGSGGACLLGGVDDPATGLPAKCDPAKDPNQECTAKLPNSMREWLPYCAPEGTCWARLATPVDKANITPKLPPSTPTFASCNRSFEPLDANVGPPWVLNTPYPSNAAMDATPSRRWRVLACINKIDPANPGQDLGGCSGQKDWGTVLTLP
jgi:hypothetical protein